MVFASGIDVELYRSMVDDDESRNNIVVEDGHHLHMVNYFSKNLCFYFPITKFPAKIL